MKICRVDSSDYFSLLRSVDVDSHTWTPLYEFSADSKDICYFDTMLEFVQTPDCTTIYKRSICVIHGNDCVLMLIGYQLTKLEFNSDGTQRSRSEKSLSIDEVNHVIQTLFKCKFYSADFEPIDSKT
jgi:arylamine N-acetyltransferase